MYLQSRPEIPLCQGFLTPVGPQEPTGHSHSRSQRNRLSESHFPSPLEEDATPSPVRGGRIYPNPSACAEEESEVLRGEGSSPNSRSRWRSPDHTWPASRVQHRAASQRNTAGLSSLPAAGCMSEGKLLYLFARDVSFRQNRSTWGGVPTWWSNKDSLRILWQCSARCLPKAFR